MPETFTISGSGFGLYGYLPAVLHVPDHRLILPERMRTVMEARNDLRPYVMRVDWRETLEACLQQADRYIIAAPPAQQPALAQQALHTAPHLKHLYLEKPVACDPATAVALCQTLREAGKTFSINYSFLFEPWCAALCEKMSANPHITLNWTFCAHHFRTNGETWKRHHAQGGGALRFYGIHLLAVVACLGDFEVTSSTLSDDSAQWQATYATAQGHRLDLNVDSNAPETTFSITCDDVSVYHDTHPFQTSTQSSTPFPDSRNAGLVQYLATPVGAARTVLYDRIHGLWAATEGLA